MKQWFNILFFLASISIFTQSKGESKSDTLKFKTDFAKLAMIDSVYSVFLADNNYNTFRYSFKSGDDVKRMPEENLIRCFIDQLNERSPFQFSYNSLIYEYIEYYAIKKKSLTEKMLAYAPMYFPVFERFLMQYKVPLEFKYLPIVESAMNPRAVSPAYAVGLWQFIYGTGKLYGLNANSYWDDKSDTYKASEAAAKHLRDLYKVFNDWTLALAAYNCGAGNVQKAIRRSGGKTHFWEIMPYLPRETRNYVPAFIAVSYIMEHYEDFNLYPGQYPVLHALMIDTLHTNGGFTLNDLAEKLDVPSQLIYALNPHFKRGVVPKDHQMKNIYLHVFQVGEFTLNKDSLEQLMPKVTIAESHIPANKGYHIVRSGENLGLIAKRYRVSVRQLQQWNKLRGTTIYVGQKLKVSP